MTDFDVLKSSGCTPFTQLIEKNFNLTHERKITISGKAMLPSLDMGKTNVKGVFSLFKSSERFISPSLSLEHENYFKIKYNCLKHSAQMNINFPKESMLKTLNYNITPDRSNARLQQNKINFQFQHQFKCSINYDSNEHFIHVSQAFKDYGTIKYLINNKGKNNIQMKVNRNLYNGPNATFNGNNLQYFNNIDLNLKNVFFPIRNIQGIMGTWQLSPMFMLNIIGGISFTNLNQFQRAAFGLYMRHSPFNSGSLGYNMNSGGNSYGYNSNNSGSSGYIGSGFKFENCFMINLPKLSQCCFASGISYKNIQMKVKLLKNELKTYININVRKMIFGAIVNYDSNKNVKYCISLNLK